MSDNWVLPRSLKARERTEARYDLLLAGAGALAFLALSIWGGNILVLFLIGLVVYLAWTVKNQAASTESMGEAIVGSLAKLLIWLLFLWRALSLFWAL